MDKFSQRLIQYWGKILASRVLIADTKPLGRIEWVETYNKTNGMPTKNYTTGWMYTDKIN